MEVTFDSSTILLTGFAISTVVSVFLATMFGQRSQTLDRQGNANAGYVSGTIVSLLTGIISFIFLVVIVGNKVNPSPLLLGITFVCGAAFLAFAVQRAEKLEHENKAYVGWVFGAMFMGLSVLLSGAALVISLVGITDQLI